MTSKYENVNELLRYYNKCQKLVDGYKTIIKTFLETLQSNYNKKNLPIKINKFGRVGSSYEDTVVHPETDFDIAMVLSKPYSMDSFKAKQSEEPGLYALKKVAGGAFSSSHLVNSNGFLKSEELKTRVCEDLLSVLRSMQSTQGYTIDAKEQYSGVEVKLRKENHYTLKLDVIPQIEGDPSDVPDWNGKDLSPFMKDIIKEKKLRVFFTLVAPPGFKKEHKENNGFVGGYGIGGGGFGGGSGVGFGSAAKATDDPKLIVSANFNIIEKEAMLSVSDTVLDSIRISKGLLQANTGLKKGGLRSFQIKRVALKYINNIDRTNDSWDGYKLIMENYINMLLKGGVEGYLIKDQQCLFRDEEQCEKLGLMLKRIFHEVNPNNVLKQLVTDYNFFKSSS